MKLSIQTYLIIVIKGGHRISARGGGRDLLDTKHSEKKKHKILKNKGFRA